MTDPSSPSPPPTHASGAPPPEARFSSERSDATDTSPPPDSNAPSDPLPETPPNAPSESSSVPPPVATRLDGLRRRLARSSELLVCLDFDGTLAPIVDDPADARPTATNRRALASLVAEPAVRTAVVSGRALSDVRTRIGVPITYAGNHGLELSRAGESSRAVHPVARRRAARLDGVCAALERALTPIPNVHVEYKELTASVHLRRVPRPARAVVRRITADVVDRFGGDAVERSTGNCVIEVSPALDWGKGDAVSLLAADRPDDAFVVFVGDDVTDESAFRSVEPEGLGVLVGRRPSRASTRVDTPEAVAGLLRWLATEGADAVAGP